MSYKKNIIICFLIVGAGVFFWWFAKHKTINDTPVYPALTFPETKPQSPESASILEQKYTNETFHFSFNYPEEFKITEKKDATGQTIIVTNPNDSREGFQIMITPFKDPVNTLTPIELKRIFQTYLLQMSSIFQLILSQKGLCLKAIIQISTQTAGKSGLSIRAVFFK